MVNFLIAIVTTLLGAVLGAYVTWVLGKPDREQAKRALELQQRIAELESVDRFAPQMAIVNSPSDESMLNIESEEPFTVFALEYLNNDKSRLWTQSVKEKGSVIQIPIADAGLLEIIKYGPWLNTYDRSATIWFRVHVEKDGHKKICEMSATIKSELKGSTMRRRVIG
ncbi:MAG: hypothetical protein LAO09_23060 [Acidobacteriia bacterium]|nr:hypothetical protein [Terriglobia bacterium]